MANYGKRGWIKLWRSEYDNPLFWSVSFDKWHAWIDLCMMADENETVKTSLEALKTRWSWGSRMKVARFLVTLSETGCVTVKSTPNKGTLIRINTGFFAKNDRKKKRANETVNETDSVIEELLPKEVGMASHEVSQPNNNERINSLEEELNDEYEQF